MNDYEPRVGDLLHHKSGRGRSYWSVQEVEPHGSGLGVRLVCVLKPHDAFCAPSRRPTLEYVRKNYKLVHKAPCLRCGGEGIRRERHGRKPYGDPCPWCQP